jgi:hypothetical protein
MGKELTRLEIPLYIRTVRMSEKRTKKYYVQGKKELPKKYTDSTRYVYKKKASKMCLFDNEVQDYVISNPRSFGTPKDDLINGQSIYNGFVSKWSRATIMRAIKNNFQPYINTLKPIEDYPIKITMEIHDLVKDPLSKNQLWDLGNRAFTYMKKFEDCLAGNKFRGKALTKQIIEDDNVTFVTGIEYKFIPIKEGEERKLIFIIEKV